MRADRLLSLLMLLQARGRMTAADLAQELEVSVRTVYRDLDALSAAGVPVYAERGPGGGCALLDGYRTTLTGLTQEELRALFMLNVPSALDDLGMSGELRGALRKLAAALPAGRREDHELVRRRIHLDWSGWERAAGPAPHLQAMQRAVWEDRKLRITYRAHIGPYTPQFERVVAPYGLVAKAGIWHLVCARDDGIQAHRASDVVAVQITDEHFDRPADFDLAVFWQDWRISQEANRPSFTATVRVAPELVPLLPYYFGKSIQPAIAGAASPDAAGWMTVVLPFERFEDARERLLGFGRAAEVLEPLALRLSIIDYAGQILDRYWPRP